MSFELESPLSALVFVSPKPCEALQSCNEFILFNLHGDFA
jgi:hypothetical protein